MMPGQCGVAKLSGTQIASSNLLGFSHAAQNPVATRHRVSIVAGQGDKYVVLELVCTLLFFSLPLIIPATKHSPARAPHNGEGSGTIGRLTHGALTRTSYYEHAVALALVPYLNPELYGEAYVW